jgi:DNA-binding MarR family transcriptional regulator
VVSSRVQPRTDDAFELANFLPYRLSLLSRLMQNLLAQNLADSGVTSAQWRVSLCLAACGPSALKTIADFTRLPLSSLSRSVAQMAERGLVRMGRDPADARVACIALTARGRRQLGKLTADIDARCDGALRLSGAEKAQLLQTLGQLIDRLSPHSQEHEHV